MLRAMRARELGSAVPVRSPLVLQSLVEYGKHVNYAFDQMPASNPQYAVAFSPSLFGGNLLVAASEDGLVTLWDTRHKSQPAHDHPPVSPGRQHSPSLRATSSATAEHVAHDNAIFDIRWITQSAAYVTASGDTTLKVFHAESTDPVAHLRGHTGSVKCVRVHQTNPSVLASSSRDGSINLWDLRSDGKGPVSSIPAAHRRPPPRQQLSGSARKRRSPFVTVPPHHALNQSTHMSSDSTTALSFIPTVDHMMLSGGTDGCIKLWDLRILPPASAPKSALESSPLLSWPAALPHGPSGQENIRNRFGTTSIDVDPTGREILVSTTDSRIYVYQTSHLDNPQPTSVLVGHHCKSFYIKAVFSPDANYVLSGSGDSKAYIWDLRKRQTTLVPRTPLLTLPAATVGEVSAVDWCRRSSGRLATGGDDGAIRVWEVDNSRGRWPGEGTAHRGAQKPATPQRVSVERTPVNDVLSNSHTHLSADSRKRLRSSGRSDRQPLRNLHITDFLS